jgi:hypothetical protein
MSKDSDQNILLNEKNWIPGFIFLLFIVFLFSRQYFPSLKDIFSDPFYFLAVVTVGVALGAPAVWILSQGRKVFFSKEESVLESDLFLTLRSLPDDFYSFQNLKIDEEEIDVVVVGLKSVSVIEIVDLKFRSKKENPYKDILERKVQKIQDYLGDSVQINLFFVLKNNLKIKRYLDADILEPKNLKNALVKKDSESNVLVLSGVEDKLESLWRKNLL